VAQKARRKRDDHQSVPQNTFPITGLLTVLGMLFSSYLWKYTQRIQNADRTPEIKSGHNNTLANTSVIAFGEQWAVIGYNGMARRVLQSIQ
jgi:hypothetical protein